MASRTLVGWWERQSGLGPGGVGWREGKQIRLLNFEKLIFGPNRFNLPCPDTERTERILDFTGVPGWLNEYFIEIPKCCGY